MLIYTINNQINKHRYSLENYSFNFQIFLTEYSHNEYEEYFLIPKCKHADIVYLLYYGNP